MTLYVNPTIIVVLASLQQAAEAAVIAAEPDGGAGTFVPGKGLRRAGDASNKVVAYEAGWPLKKGQRSAFATALGGPINLLGAGAPVQKDADRWMFDANVWSRERVLSALGLADLVPTLQEGE